MEILIKAAQLILSLSILVVLHELGHFLPARFGSRRASRNSTSSSTLVLALQEEDRRHRVRHRLASLSVAM
jgi:membrane-associated protease RseP (regulator of RpoE activity)